MPAAHTIRPIQLGIVTTLQGRRVNLGELTPAERRIWLLLLNAAGGVSLFEDPPQLPEPNPISPTRPEELLDPPAFRALARLHLQRDLDRAEFLHAERGPLWELLEDLELRLGRAQLGWQVATLRHDPRHFLRFVFEESRSLGEFSDRTGLNYSQSSKVLSALHGALSPESSEAPAGGGAAADAISVSALAKAAALTGFSFSMTRLHEGEESAHVVTCRDITIQALGQKMLAVWTLEETETEAEAMLRTEFRARAGEGDGGLVSALRLARLYKAQLGLRAGSARVAVFHIGRGADLAPFAWLFLAMEFRWFEEQGITPLVRPLGGEQVQAKLLQPEGDRRINSIEIPRPSELNREWIAEDLSLIHRAVFEPMEIGGLVQSFKTFEQALTNCRNWGHRILSADELNACAVPVIEAWCKALEVQIPSLPDIRSSFTKAVTLALIGHQVPNQSEPIDSSQSVSGVETLGRMALRFNKPKSSPELWDYSAKAEAV